MTVYQYIEQETNRNKLYDGIKNILKQMDKQGHYPEDWEVKKIQRVADARYNELTVKDFINAIKTISEKPKNLDNLESYLIYHFSDWLQKFANTPEGITDELKNFAEMEI